MEHQPPSPPDPPVLPRDLCADGTQTDGLAACDSTQTDIGNVAGASQTEGFAAADATQTDNTAEDEAVQTLPPPPPT